MRISDDQFEALETRYERNFLVGAVADFRVLFEKVFAQPTRVPVETQWAIAAHVQDELDAVYLHSGSPAAYRMIHKLLRAAELGASPAAMREALAVFLRCAPSEEAGLVLADAILETQDEAV